MAIITNPTSWLWELLLGAVTPSPAPKKTGQTKGSIRTDGTVIQNGSGVPKAPGTGFGGVSALTGGTDDGDGSGYDPYAAQVASQNAAARAQSQRENEATQSIINTLLGSLSGYSKGRDTQVSNAEAIYANALKGLDSQYANQLLDLLNAAKINEGDETAKTFANRQNRSRERQSILEQAASQGAGETDQLRAIIQAFENADANQLEVTQSYYDSLTGINNSLGQANTSTENARRNAWGQKQDALSQAMNEYYKNYTQTWTDIQRTAANNTNVDSSASVAFNANFNGYDPLTEATKYVGVVRKFEDPDENVMKNWSIKEEKIGRETTPTQNAPMTRIGGIKAADGADLRKWNNE